MSNDMSFQLAKIFVHDNIENWQRVVDNNMYGIFSIHYEGQTQLVKFNEFTYQRLTYALNSLCQYTSIDNVRESCQYIHSQVIDALKYLTEEDYVILIDTISKHKLPKFQTELESLFDYSEQESTTTEFRHQ